jgi:hypothetical protein
MVPDRSDDFLAMGDDGQRVRVVQEWGRLRHAGTG